MVNLSIDLNVMMWKECRESQITKHCSCSIQQLSRKRQTNACKQNVQQPIFFFERRKLQVDTFTASGGTLHTRWYYNESVNCHGTLKVHKCPPWCYNKTFSHFLYKQYHLRYWHTSSASFVSLTHTGFRLLTHTTSSHCGVLLWLDDKNTLWY